MVSAIIYGHVEAATLLLDRGANPNSRLDYGYTPLFYAVTSSLEVTALLLSRGADVHLKSDGGHDLLHRYLVDIGPGPRLIAPLATSGVPMVKRLLDAGLDVRARNADQPHSLLACEVGNLPILELLLAAGSDPNATDREGGVLWRAMKLGRTASVLPALVRYGIDPNTRCTNAAADTTLLMEVCALGDVATAKALLDRGADVNARGRGTPLTRAEERGHQVLVDLLLERGARPLTPTLDAAVTRTLEAAEAAARARPEAPETRLAWADALLTNGFRAAAASEVEALRRRGAAVPPSLSARLAFENPAGVRWTFAPFQPAVEGVAPRTADARFPGALVTDGVRTLPLVVTLGPPCERCDEQGEQVCSTCGGTGSWVGMFSDDPYDCEPRQRCSTCRGLKFVVTGSALGAGSCRHPPPRNELEMGPLSLRRCPDCGLAALCGPGDGLTAEYRLTFACGVCGQFACRCAAGSK